MRWQGGRESENVEDRRGSPATGVLVGGGIGTLVILLIGLFLGADPAALLQQLQPQQGQQGPQADGEQRPLTPEEEEAGKFVKTVLAFTEDVWTEQFRQMGKEYRKPTLVMFTGAVDSGCGNAQAAMGPFYCPADQKVYIDLSFFDELARMSGTSGEFAQAYVIAHEIGHHVQNLLGTSDKVSGARGRVSEVEQNQLSVMLELQADLYAGLWANHTNQMANILERGDIEKALAAAKAIGDDTLQRKAQGRVRPDSFTHGSSEQRVK